MFSKLESDDNLILLCVYLSWFLHLSVSPNTTDRIDSLPTLDSCQRHTMTVKMSVYEIEYFIKS